MGEIQISGGANGAIEQFGATSKLTDALLANYGDRGNQAAALVVATLTESPYTPVLDGDRFEVEVSNKYRGTGSDEADTADTVDSAKAALAEFLGAEVPGAKNIPMLKLKTYYPNLMKNVLPERKASGRQKGAFNEAMVERLRARGVDVGSPEQALRIVLFAPKWLSLLKLTDNLACWTSDPELNDAVTSEGRIVQVVNWKKSTLYSEARRDSLSMNIATRGGTAPGSTIVHQIQQRVIQLRTGDTKR